MSKPDGLNPDGSVWRNNIQFVRLEEFGRGEIGEGAQDGQEGLYFALQHAAPEVKDKGYVERYLLPYEDVIRLRNFLNGLDLPEVPADDTSEAAEQPEF